jgi:hypothetical protein
MTTTLFLRSYRQDLKWVPHALRSIQKFVSGLTEIVLSVPASDMPAFQQLNLTRERLVTSRVQPGRLHGYLDQQLDKLMADEYTGSDYILFWDSDLIACRPFDAADLMLDGKPRCLMTPYSKLVKADGRAAVPWQPITEKALGHGVEYEFMRQHPMMAPREALQGFRQYMQQQHQLPLADYLAKQPSRAFSEFNALFAWCYHHRPDLMTFWDTVTQGLPAPFAVQFWSYSGLTPDERAKIERILA